MSMEYFEPIERGTQYPAHVVVDWYWKSANGTFSRRVCFHHDIEAAFEFCRELARDFQTTSVTLRFDTENTGDQLSFFNTFGHLQGMRGQLDLDGKPKEEAHE